MAQELDDIIREESRQREARRSIVSEISHFSVDSNEDNDIDREARFDSSGEPLKTPMIGEETFSLSQSHAFPTPLSTVTGRRRSSAISYSNGYAASHDPRKSTHNRPTHIELPIKPYPAGEGLPLQSPPFSNGSNEHPLPFSPASSSVRGIKSPPASVAGTEKTFWTDITGMKAEKRLHIPFVPRSLKITTKDDQMTPRQSEDSRAQVDRGDGDSFLFESDADASPLTDVTISEARPASAAGKPRLIQRFSNRVVGLREILDSGPEAPNIFDRKDSVKRQGVIGLPETQEGDSDVVTPRGTGLLSPEEPPKGSFGFFPRSLADGLRSNPVAKAIRGAAPELQSNRASIVSNGDRQANGKEVNATHNESRSPGKLDKKVTFPLPLHLVDNRNRELEERRQRIVSTPYPLGYKSSKSNISQNRSKKQKENAATDDPSDMLTFAVYTSRSKIPHIRRISVPASTEKTLSGCSDEKRPPATARLVNDFDDEKLFRLIRSEYYSMKGLLRGRFGATTARRLRVIEYHILQDLTNRPLLSSCTLVGTGQDVLLEKTPLDLFLHPKDGRKQHRWTRWVRSLPGNTARPNPKHDFSTPSSRTNPPLEEKDMSTDVVDHAPMASVLCQPPPSFALVLEEGFSPTRIFFTLTMIILIAITATLLWIFLGLTGQPGTDSSTAGPTIGNPANGFTNEMIESGHVKETGFRDAGSRVQTGIIIGIGTLLLGLSGVGGWIGIGYLAR